MKIYFCFLFVCCTAAVKLPTPWCLYPAKLCEEFDRTSPAIIIQESCPGFLLSSDVDPELYLMAPVILWSPLEQFSRNIMCPKWLMDHFMQEGGEME